MSVSFTRYGWLVCLWVLAVSFQVSHRPSVVVNHSPSAVWIPHLCSQPDPGRADVSPHHQHLRPLWTSHLHPHERCDLLPCHFLVYTRWSLRQPVRQYRHGPLWPQRRLPAKRRRQRRRRAPLCRCSVSSTHRNWKVCPLHISQIFYTDVPSSGFSSVSLLASVFVSVQYISQKFLTQISGGALVHALRYYLSILLMSRLGIGTQLAIVIGIMVTQGLGFLFATPKHWRLVLFISTALSFLQYFTSSFVTESPVYLRRLGKLEQQKRAAQRLWGDDLHRDRES